MLKSINEIIDNPDRDCIYPIIGYLQPEICVDIGAAAGHVTRRICMASGARTKVYAYEPFPSNHEFFEKFTEDLPNDITLVKKAVSNRTGKAELFVGSVVTENAPGWTSYSGYSSVGYLTFAAEANKSRFDSSYPKLLQFRYYIKPKIKGLLHSIIDLPYPKIFSVETTTLDQEFPDAHISLVKIDVQGAEAEVLQGAKDLLHDKRVDVLYVEWSGEQEVLEIIHEHNYEIYDSVYIVIPKDDNIEAFKEIGYQYIKSVKLSTGVTAYEMLYTNTKISPVDAINEARKRGLGWIHTDLIAISPDARDAFTRAIIMYTTQ